MLGGIVSRERACNQTQTLFRGRAETTAYKRIRRGPWQQKTGRPESSRVLQVVTKTVYPVTATEQTVVQVVTFDSVRRTTGFAAWKKDETTGTHQHGKKVNDHWMVGKKGLVPTQDNSGK